MDKIAMDLQRFANDDEGLLLQSSHYFQINTTPDNAEATWRRLGAGLNSFEPTINDEVEQDFYLDSDGFASSDVVGAQLILSFSGHRKYGDPAQDYIFEELLLKIGKNRKTELLWTRPNGDQIQGEVTIAEIEGPGGDANSKGEVSFEAHFNGKPTYKTSDEVGYITVESTNPDDGEVNVAVGTVITATFDRDIQQAGSWSDISLRDENGVAVAMSKSISDDTLTIDPDQDLQSGMEYTVKIPAKSVADADYIKRMLEEKYEFSFTTE